MALKPHRSLLLPVVLALPLLLGHCGGKQSPDSMRKVLMQRENALAAADAEWAKKQVRAQAGAQSIPLARLEALGEMSLRSRDYESSLLNFLEILKDDPSRYDLRYKVGVIYFLNGQLEPAKRELAMVLVQHPEMLQAHEALGLVHLEEKHYALAIDEFQQVLSRDPRRAKTHHLLGIAYLEAGQPQRAISEFQRVLTLDPGNIASLTTLGQVYLRQDNYTRALIPLKKAQTLAPQNPKVNRELGMALAGLKRYPEALQAFMKAGDEAQAFNNLGVFYFKDGQYEDAAKCFQKALDLRTTFYQEAKTNLQRALEKLQQSHKDS